MKKPMLGLLAGLLALLGLSSAQSARATWDPHSYYMECYVDTGPHAYERDSCYSFVQQGPATANAYFSPSTAVLVLEGSGISPPYTWSVAACNSLPLGYPCVVQVGNHHEKTVTFSIPNFNLSVGAVAGYDMGVIP